MARFVTYTAAGRGHLFPIIPTLLELRDRGHEVVVYVDGEDMALIETAGLEARRLDPRMDELEHTGHTKKNPLAELRVETATFAARAKLQAPQLEAAIEELRPDGLIIDTLAWGAMAAADASGLPWVMYAHTTLPLRSAHVPPYGLGLKPRTDAIGRVRDFAAYQLGLRQAERIAKPYINEVRVERGLRPVEDSHDFYGQIPPRVLYFTAEPFEYPRDDWPESVMTFGPGLWDPDTEPPPDWLADLADPLVLVTTSSLYQDDEKLVRVALEALPGHVGSVVVTTAGWDPVGLEAPENVRIERFLPHRPILERAAAVVSHSGMGITQKALAYGVPVVAVPFGRDQFEVARRLEVAGAGTRLPARQLTPEKLRAAVDGAIAMKPGAQRIAAAFAAAGGAPAAADALEAMLPVAVAA
jgi:MGT family glycosyltransferase